MKIAIVIITCPGRETLLKATVESLCRTDVFPYLIGSAGMLPNPPAGAAPATRLHLQHDETTYERRQERQEHNSLAALKKVLAVHPSILPDVILFCEDDIIFNTHLRHNLEHWKPLLDMVQATTDATVRGRLDNNLILDDWTKIEPKDFFFGSLYDPTIRELAAFPDDHYFVADPEAVYGSQCFVMNRKMAEYFVEHWWEVPGMQDIKMSRMAARVARIHYHLPSLVQHVGFKSVWGGHYHDTKSFDGEFRAHTK